MAFFASSLEKDQKLVFLIYNKNNNIASFFKMAIIKWAKDNSRVSSCIPEINLG